MTLNNLNINDLLLSTKLHPILASIKGFRNGAVYGGRVRFAHSLAMALLFHKGSLKLKLANVVRLTIEHAKRLATFALFYKGLLSAFIVSNKGKELNWHSFIAGLIPGYFVFGDERSSVGKQVVLYMFSRSVLGLGNVFMKRCGRSSPPKPTFSIFAAFTWATAMWLFRHHHDTLQPSLEYSMQYIYNDSDYWTNFENFFLRSCKK